MVIVSPGSAAPLSSAAVVALLALALLGAPRATEAQPTSPPVASTIWIPVIETTASDFLTRLGLDRP